METLQPKKGAEQKKMNGKIVQFHVQLHFRHMTSAFPIRSVSSARTLSASAFVSLFSM